MLEDSKNKLTRLMFSQNERRDLSSNALALHVVVGPITLPREISIVSSMDQNPGIGGSEFHSIQLALILREAGFSVSLEVFGSIPKVTGVARIERDTRLDQSSGVRIVNTAMAVSIPRLFSESQKLILVSHHPHDGWLKSLLKGGLRVVAVVNVGRYQFFSNKVASVKKVWLPAFTPVTSSTQNHVRSKLSYRAGHISSFHPSKGFHIIVRGWLLYVNRLVRSEQCEMQVIGADTLYRGGAAAPDGVLFPISGRYGQRIRKQLENANPNSKKSIRFEGLINESPSGLIRNWNVAIFNPLGFGEADPIVIQDALSVSTPVIAGSLFGLYDYMRFFPELTAHTSFGIAKRLSQLDGNPELQKSIQLRTVEFYSKLCERRRRTEALWIEAISNISQGLSISGLDVGEKEPALWWRLIVGGLLLRMQNSVSKIFSKARLLRQS